MIKVALAGNPNCGKTTLFNALTGATAYVGNWPGVTVEKLEGVYYKKGKKKDQGIGVVDLPGIYSLSPYTPEEVISRNFILNEHPDAVINVVDATNLERNLYLSSQILEMDVPVVIALNMMDAVADQKREIDVRALSKAFGVPVIPVSALRDRGLSELMEAVAEAAKKPRVGKSFLPFKNLEQLKGIYEGAEVASPLFHAIKALEKDEIEEKEFPELYKSVQEAAKNDAVDYEAEVADKRYHFLTPLCKSAIKGKEKQASAKMSRSDKIDRILTNRWLGLLIAIVVLFAIFHLTFAGDLFYMHAMGLDLGEGYPGFISWTMPDGDVVHPFAGLFYDDAGVCSIGEFFHRLAGDNETGILGCICLGFKALLEVCGSPEWVISMFHDGIFNGVAAVLGFVPQILILFFFFSIMEDSGYMARIAFILDRIFRRFGVSGRAFLPMIMGFGCGVPAMMNTRTLASDKERTKTIRVIPFFTCGAKAEFLAVIAAAVAAAINLDAGLFTFLMYLLGVVVAMVAVIVMNKTTQREKTPPFLMELPAYHAPRVRSLLLHVWDKGKHFIKKAFTIIFVSTVVIWLLSNFTWNWVFIPTADEALGLDVSESILAGLSKFIQPIFTPLGFGYNTEALREYGWTFTAASIQGVVAKENVTATVETLAGVLIGEGAGFPELCELCGISTPALVAFAVFNMLTIPCFASVATAKGELATRKDYIGTIVFWVGTSYALGVLAYITLEWVWTLAITLPLVAAACACIFFYDRVMKKKEAAAKEA